MQTRNKNARNCSRSAKNLQTRNTHPFSVANRNHPPPLRGRPESPTTLPRRFSGQGLISWWGPCPLEVPGWPKCGQGVAPEIRPCPSECGWWATLPVEAGPAATAALAAGSNIPEGLSSPAALAQRQECPVGTGHEGKRRAVKWLCINDILKTNRPK